MTMLFVYGQLRPDQPGFSTISHDVRHHMPDSIQAELFNLGTDAAVVKVGQTSEWIHGFTLTVPDSLFKRLDKSEAPQYKRQLTKSRRGDAVYVYAYTLRIPSVAIPVKEWTGGSK